MSEDREQRNQVFGQAIQAGGMPTMSVAERLKQEFGIVVPAELVKLPSGGKVYPPTSGLHMREEVEIKAMTTHEENILTSRAFIKKGTVITELIKSCVVDKSIVVEDMVAGDRNALMIAIRITGYGAEYQPEMKCPSCGQNNECDFNLGKLAIKTLGMDPVSPGVNEFECALPASKAKATFKLLTARDEEELVTLQERKKKVIGSTIDSLVSDQIKAAMLSVNGMRDRSKLSFFIDNMSSRDSLAFRNAMTRAKPDVDMTQLFECKFCDHSEEVDVPVTSDFFWPKSRG